MLFWILPDQQIKNIFFGNSRGKCCDCGNCHAVCTVKTFQTSDTEKLQTTVCKICSFESAAPTNTHQWASKRQTCFAGKNVQSAFGLFSWNLSGIWPLLLRAPPFKWNCHGGGIEFQQITKVIGSSRLPMNQSNVACLTCQSPFQFFTMASQNLITDVFKKNIPARDPKQQCGKVGG